MKSHSQKLLKKAIAATVAAIEIYNKPTFQYRGETFSILAINGWELLVKAKWLDENNDDVQSFYIEDKTNRDPNSNVKTFKRNRSGNPLTHDLVYLAKKLIEKKHLTQNTLTNIEMLLEIRDSSIHFYNSSREFTNKLQTIGAASIQNFASLAQEWFGRDLSKFDFHLMPLSFIALPSQTDAVILNREEQNFLAFLNKQEIQADENDSQYAVTINFEVKLMRSKSKDALEFVVTSDPDATPIHVAEEQVLEQFPWNYGKLTEKCRARYSNFKQDKKYYTIKKLVEKNKENVLCKTRYLDPENPNSAKKRFYKPEILAEFDKHYEKS